MPKFQSAFGTVQREPIAALLERQSDLNSRCLVSQNMSSNPALSGIMGWAEIQLLSRRIFGGKMSSDSEKSSLASSDTFDDAPKGERDQSKSEVIVLPCHVAESGTLDRLVDTARGYAEASTAENTNKSYAADWKPFTRWCRPKGMDPLPRSPEMVGLYLAELAAPAGKTSALSVSTIKRRLSGLSWNYTQRRFTLNRKDRHIATLLAGIKRKHARPPDQKEAILPEDIQAMVTTLPYDLRGLRDRAILLIGYAGGLRLSEIVSFDVHKDDTPDSGGWIDNMEKGALLTLNAKTSSA